MILMGKRLQVRALDPTVKLLPNTEAITSLPESWTSSTLQKASQLDNIRIPLVPGELQNDKAPLNCYARKTSTHVLVTNCYILKRRVFKAFLQHSNDAKNHRRTEQIAGQFQMIRYYTRWKKFCVVEKAERRMLTKYYLLWRNYASIEAAEQEHCRKLRMAAFHRKKVHLTRALLGFKKSVEIIREKEQYAIIQASTLLLRRSLSTWNANVQNERIKKEKIARMNDLLFDGHLRFSRKSFNRWKTYHARQKQTEFVCRLVSKLNETVLSKQAFLCWVKWIHSERRVSKRKRHEIRKIIWRWRSFTENNVYWKQRRKKALTHLANRICKRVFYQWFECISEKKSKRKKETAEWRNALLSRLDEKTNVVKDIQSARTFHSEVPESPCKAIHPREKAVDSCQGDSLYRSFSIYSNNYPVVKIPPWIAEKLRENQNSNLNQMRSNGSEHVLHTNESDNTAMHSPGMLSDTLGTSLITPNIPEWIMLELQKLSSPTDDNGMHSAEWSPEKGMQSFCKSPFLQRRR